MTRVGESRMGTCVVKVLNNIEPRRMLVPTQRGGGLTLDPQAWAGAIVGAVAPLRAGGDGAPALDEGVPVGNEGGAAPMAIDDDGTAKRTAQPRPRKRGHAAEDAGAEGQPEGRPEGQYRRASDASANARRKQEREEACPAKPAIGLQSKQHTGDVEKFINGSDRMTEPHSNEDRRRWPSVCPWEGQTQSKRSSMFLWLAPLPLLKTVHHIRLHHRRSPILLSEECSMSNQQTWLDQASIKHRSRLRSVRSGLQEAALTGVRNVPRTKCTANES